MIQWNDLHHSQLTVQQLYALLQLRCEVFVVEQACLYQDVDGDDLVGENRHILGWRDGKLVAYARILKSEEEFEPVVIGRVIVSQAVRGEKLGVKLMEQTLASCEQHWPQKALYLGHRLISRHFMLTSVLLLLPTFMTKTVFHTSVWLGKRSPEALSIVSGQV